MHRSVLQKVLERKSPRGMANDLMRRRGNKESKLNTSELLFWAPGKGSRKVWVGTACTRGDMVWREALHGLDHGMGYERLSWNTFLLSFCICAGSRLVMPECEPLRLVGALNSSYSTSSPQTQSGQSLSLSWSKEAA